MTALPTAVGPTEGSIVNIAPVGSSANSAYPMTILNMIVAEQLKKFKYDVDKLRVKLLEGTKDEDRILAARKVFKTRCFSTRQIRALSEVFTTDAAKFHFFEAAYPFCSDDQFRELSSLLADPVYSSKFRVMTEHQ